MRRFASYYKSSSPVVSRFMFRVRCTVLKFQVSRKFITLHHTISVVSIAFLVWKLVRFERSIVMPSKMVLLIILDHSDYSSLEMPNIVSSRLIRNMAVCSDVSFACKLDFWLGRRMSPYNLRPVSLILFNECLEHWCCGALRSRSVRRSRSAKKGVAQSGAVHGSRKNSLREK